MARTTDTGKQKPSGKKKPSSPEQLIKDGKESKTELSEDELKDVTGGFKIIF